MNLEQNKDFLVSKQHTKGVRDSLVLLKGKSMCRILLIRCLWDSKAVVPSLRALPVSSSVSVSERAGEVRHTGRVGTTFCTHSVRMGITNYFTLALGGITFRSVTGLSAPSVSCIEYQVRSSHGAGSSSLLSCKARAECWRSPGHMVCGSGQPHR